MKFSKSDQYSEKNRKKAIALKYDQSAGKAPLIVAKGMGDIAEQIIKLAEENDIHIHESPELVEVLIRLELGDEIPESLYRAIAEVIAFAYSLKHGNQEMINKAIQQNIK
ncbi:EscU/YscU/HrcU family type III secretion system export apparatus switch protein [Neptuniibacter sp. 1_MG-2023]|jgi:flagellar biosynthesis protein|uniref:EscU/YscU/HrcU family type III secretion system export apparatus switch protein n=1 Tax=Neptuniibacter sp. 1_MG-2023 TaxID=3062662 RepID=UPI0026E37B7B|nr:EscU/YscU/HrcU family type III secretion system export apparatus switch protein [Neptuniibacter sp. 1_MG-2023]MDO6595241.1 EscU/YscU/HrcU family type III secretion system export apparatus switch protein [Neptuniibacter sp. 1_MG-2023]